MLPDPPSPLDAMLAAGLAAHRSGDRPGAGRHYQAVLAAVPDHPEALNLLGALLIEENRLDAARPLIQRALAALPDHPYALMNRSVIARADGDAVAAEHDARRAVALLPLDVGARHNLANVLLDRGEAAEAEVLLDQVLATAPDHAEAQLARAMARLALGRWPEGWQDFEARWRTTTFRSYPPALQSPTWDGGPTDRPLVLIAEQGFGDALQFIRYASDLTRHAPERILVAHPPLHGLLARVAGVDRVQGFDAPLPEGAATVGLMSLPRWVEPEPQPRPPYLRAEPDAVVAWRARWAGEQRPRVGLCWHGMARRDIPLAMQIDRRRSLRLDEMQPLLGLDHFAWISLQTDPPDDLADALLPSVAAELTSFDATAALVAALDLVVTVDTAVAHLAGGLGVPTVLLNRHGGCWRWGLDASRTTSPWYPCLRLVTQGADESWDGVVARVIRGLSAWSPEAALPEAWQ